MYSIQVAPGSTSADGSLTIQNQPPGSSGATAVIIGLYGAAVPIPIGYSGSLFSYLMPGANTSQPQPILADVTMDAGLSQGISAATGAYPITYQNPVTGQTASLSVPKADYRARVTKTKDFIFRACNFSGARMGQNNGVKTPVVYPPYGVTNVVGRQIALYSSRLKTSASYPYAVMPVLKSDGTVDFYRFDTVNYFEIARADDVRTEFYTQLDTLGLSNDSKKVKAVQQYDNDVYVFMLAVGGAFEFGTTFGIAPYYLYRPDVVWASFGKLYTLSSNVMFDGTNDTIIPLLDDGERNDIVWVWDIPSDELYRKCVRMFSDGSIEFTMYDGTVVDLPALAQAPMDFIEAFDSLYAVYPGYRLELVYGSGQQTIACVNYSYFGDGVDEWGEIFMCESDSVTQEDMSFALWIGGASTVVPGSYFDEGYCPTTTAVQSSALADTWDSYALENGELIFRQAIFFKADGDIDRIGYTGHMVQEEFGTNADYFSYIAASSRDQLRRLIYSKPGEPIAETVTASMFISTGSNITNYMIYTFGTTENTKDDFEWSQVR